MRCVMLVLKAKRRRLPQPHHAAATAADDDDDLHSVDAKMRMRMQNMRLSLKLPASRPPRPRDWLVALHKAGCLPLLSCQKSYLSVCLLVARRGAAAASWVGSNQRRSEVWRAGVGSTAGTVGGPRAWGRGGPWEGACRA